MRLCQNLRTVQLLFESFESRFNYPSKYFTRKFRNRCRLFLKASAFLSESFIMQKYAMKSTSASCACRTVDETAQPGQPN